MRPYKVLLFIAVVMAILGTLYWAFPDVKLDLLAFHSHTSDLVVQEDTIAEFPVFEEQDTTPHPLTPNPLTPQPLIPKVSVDSTTDSRVFLQSFYASLPQAGERVVRVLHYGDSQIEEDRITMQIRERLQQQYGGRGVGLMPLVQTIPTRTVRQELRMNGHFVTPQQGPRRYIVYGFKRDQLANGLYGPMGQLSMLNDSLVSGSEEVTAICKPQVSTARYDTWRVFADSTIHSTFSGDTVQLSGRGAVYALSQQSETGVIVDNIPMRGCIGTVFTKMDSTQLSTFYREQNVRLIILQYGGNAIPSNQNPGTIAAIVKGLRQQVQYLRTCAPEASILFIGPSDMLTQIDGEWTTYPMVPYMDRLLRKMALEENIAYFSLYRWMGGSGSMNRWREVGLAGNDGVHFTRAGARKAGNAIAEWILDGMD